MPSTFSYLPPGTPPWPSTPLPKMPYPHEIEAAQQTSAEATSTGKAKRTGRPILAGLVFLVLIPVLFAGVTLGSLYAQGLFPPGSKSLPKVVVPASTAQASSNDTTAATPAPSTGGQLPTPSSYKKTANQDVNLSMQYPADWVEEAPSKSTTDTSIAIHPPQSQQIPIVVSLTRFSDSRSSTIPSADAINQGTISAISNVDSGTNVQNVPAANPQPTVAGVQWTESDATFQITNTSGNSLTLHLITLSVKRNKDYYNIVFLTQDVIYSEAAAKYMQPMLSSVQFIA